MTEGQIQIDGKDYQPTKDVNFSKEVGYMNQDVFLFTDTIRYNICLEEEYSDEEIWSVLKEVGLYDVVSALPQQLDEEVGALGSKFSGGEKQRIALARILIRRFPLVLLDEATSAVDVATTRFIEKQLLENPDMTVLMISHHLQEDIKPYLTDILYLS